MPPLAAARNRSGSLIRIVSYLLKELIPQFLSSLIIICAIIVVSQLVRLSEVLVTFGLSLENVFLPFLYIILPFLSMAIPMAYLFAVVLSFGRLSADGEYAALLAAGYSLKRAARPVMVVALVLYLSAAFCGMYLEAWGRRELVQFFYRKTQTELDNLVRYKMQAGVFLSDFLGYVIYAEKISPDRSHFENVLLAPGGDRKAEPFTLLAPSGAITGTVENGNLRLSLDNGVAYARKDGTDKVSLLKFTRAEIDLLRIFHEQILGKDDAEDDYRSYSPQDLRRYIDKLRADKTSEAGLVRRAEFLYHQRIAWPFAVVGFALFGMVLGISDPRRGKNMAYIGAILSTLGGYVVFMAFKWLAENGHLGIVLGVWLPNIVICAFGMFLVVQKHRLPPSEATLELANLPLIGRRRD